MLLKAKFEGECLVCGMRFDFDIESADHISEHILSDYIFSGLRIAGWSFSTDSEGKIYAVKCPKCTKEGVGK